MRCRAHFLKLEIISPMQIIFPSLQIQPVPDSPPFQENTDTDFLEEGWRLSGGRVNLGALQSWLGAESALHVDLGWPQTWGGVELHSLCDTILIFTQPHVDVSDSRVCVCCLRACVHVCVHVFVWMSVLVCVCICVHVCACAPTVDKCPVHLNHLDVANIYKHPFKCRCGNLLKPSGEMNQGRFWMIFFYTALHCLVRLGLVPKI